MTQLEQAIQANRKRHARHAIASSRWHRIVRRIFDYEDEGRGEKAQRVLDLLRTRMEENRGR